MRGADDAVVERMLTDGVARELTDPSTDRALLIGLQLPETVQEIGRVVGAERLVLLHLDVAAGTVDALPGARSAFYTDGVDLGGQFAVVALSCGSARSYDLLRDAVRMTAAWVAPAGAVLVAGPRKGGAEVAARTLREVFHQVTLLEYRKGQRIFRASGLKELGASALTPMAYHGPPPLRGVPTAPSPSRTRGPLASTNTGPPLRGANIGSADIPSGLPASPFPASRGERRRSDVLPPLPRSGGGVGGGGVPPTPSTYVLQGQQIRLAPDRRIFAKGRLDAATELLANSFEVRPGEAVLDLGCGSGVLGILAALLQPSAQCALVDSDPLAVEAARRNAALNGTVNVSVVLSDVLAALPGRTFDLVLTNPPFHRGRAKDTEIARRFMTEAATALRPGGRLYVVGSRFLPYEAVLQELTGTVQEVAGDQRYKVLLSRRAR